MKRIEMTFNTPLDLVNSLPYGTALLDEKGNLLCMNDELSVMTGYNSAHVVGLPFNFILKSGLANMKQFLAQLFQAGEKKVIETDIINNVRRRVPVRITASVMSAVSRLVLLCCVEDISALNQMNGQKAGKRQGLSLLGHSVVMQELMDFLPVLAKTDATVLITGETGTGKDLAAKAIHDASKRAAYPFIKVNCGALPDTLLESELFGHVKGAFTGANTDKPGMFKLAHGGTLFLTEIGDLPHPLQVKLLTVLDDREFYPLGSSKKVQVDVRLITGTHRNLRELIKEGSFREDLFFRLNVLKMHMPSLRERYGDVRFLAEHFLHKFAADLGKNISGFSKEALDLIERYSFPGNVRELRNIIEYAVNICVEGRVTPSHLPESLFHGDDRLESASMHKLALGAEHSHDPGFALSSEAVHVQNKIAESDTASIFDSANWQAIEKKMILDAMVKCRGNRTQAAEKLGWSRSTLWRKMKGYSIG